MTTDALLRLRQWIKAACAVALIVGILSLAFNPGSQVTLVAGWVAVVVNTAVLILF